MEYQLSIKCQEIIQREFIVREVGNINFDIDDLTQKLGSY